jgi:hypothetical protein
MLQATKFLDLAIRLEKVPMLGGPTCEPPQHLAAHQILQACFPPRSTRAGILRRLRVELCVMPLLFIAYKHQLDQLRRALDGNLSALRNLHGLAEVYIIKFSPIINHMWGLDYPTATLLPWKKEFMAILFAFSKDLVRSINP